MMCVKHPVLQKEIDIKIQKQREMKNGRRLLNMMVNCSRWNKKQLKKKRTRERNNLKPIQIIN